MKTIFGLILIAVLGIGAAEARAQDASLPINSDDSPDSERALTSRTPVMIVHDGPLPAPKPSTTPLAKPATGNTKAAPEKTTSAAAPKSASGPQSPIVMHQSFSTDASSEMGTTGNPKYDELVKQSASRNGVDPNLMLAVMRQESGFNSRALSYKGATGLMQLMPGTAARFGVTNIYDPAQNIEGGARYLRFLLDTFDGDVKLALAGYNAGENAVVNSGFKIPRYRETQNYVRSISARYDASRTGSAKKPAPPKQSAPEAATFSGGKLSNNY